MQKGPQNQLFPVPLTEQTWTEFKKCNSNNCIERKTVNFPITMAFYYSYPNGIKQIKDTQLLFSINAETGCHKKV